MYLKLFVVFISAMFLSACAGDLKAPCNQYATFCGTKTKINHW